MINSKVGCNLCGIFGIFVGKGSNLSIKLLKEATDNLFKLSESRGKEASGIIVRIGQFIYVIKEPIPASDLIKSEEYNRIFYNIIKSEGYMENNLEVPFAIVGHSRLVTNGQSELNSNNQPVIKDGAVGVHNGIIVNDKYLWESFPILERKYDVDTEVFLSILQMFRRNGKTIIEAVRNTFGCIQGSASVGILFDDLNLAVLATNTGSLYACVSSDNKFLIFSSERYILKQLISTKALSHFFEKNSIQQIRPNNAYIINLISIDKLIFDLSQDTSSGMNTSYMPTPQIKTTG